MQECVFFFISGKWQAFGFCCSWNVGSCLILSQTIGPFPDIQYCLPWLEADLQAVQTCPWRGPKLSQQVLFHSTTDSPLKTWWDFLYFWSWAYNRQCVQRKPGSVLGWRMSPHIMLAGVGIAGILFQWWRQGTPSKWEKVTGIEILRWQESSWK